MSTHESPALPSRGLLTTGFVGSLLFGGAYLLLAGLAVGGRSGAVATLIPILGIASVLGAIVMSIGIFASARALTGWQIASGIFAILAGIGGLALWLVPALIQFNSSSDMRIVMVAVPSGTTLLWGIFAITANQKVSVADGSNLPIVVAGYLYGAGAILAGIGIKFGLGERGQTAGMLAALSALIMASAVIVHGVGLLRLGGRRPAATEVHAVAAS